MYKLAPLTPAAARTYTGKPRKYLTAPRLLSTTRTVRMAEPMIAAIMPCHQSKPIETRDAPRLYEDGLNVMVR